MGNIEKKTGIIVLLDILGTKSKWQNDKAQKFLETMDEMYSEIDEFVKTLNSVLQTTSQLDIPLEIDGKKVEDLDEVRRFLSNVKIVTSTTNLLLL